MSWLWAGFITVIIMMILGLNSIISFALLGFVVHWIGNKYAGGTFTFSLPKS